MLRNRFHNKVHKPAEVSTQRRHAEEESRSIRAFIAKTPLWSPESSGPGTCAAKAAKADAGRNGCEVGPVTRLAFRKMQRARSH